jgi:hypothetical protein
VRLNTKQVFNCATEPFLVRGAIKYKTSIQLRHGAFLVRGAIKYKTSIQLRHGAFFQLVVYKSKILTRWMFG